VLNVNTHLINFPPGSLTLIIPLPTADTDIAVAPPVVVAAPVIVAVAKPPRGEKAAAFPVAVVVEPKLLKPNVPPVG
jgi:hypothetical protein